MGGRRGAGGKRRASCKSPSGGRWWRGAATRGPGATWRSRRARGRTRASALAQDQRRVVWGGRSGAGWIGRRRGRAGTRRSLTLGTVGMRAGKVPLGQEAGILQDSNRVRLRSWYPSSPCPPCPSDGQLVENLLWRDNRG